MDPNTQKFLDAFAQGGDRQDARGDGSGSTHSPAAREKAFQVAFGNKEQGKPPVPLKGQTWRFDMTKVAKLSFQEQYSLSQYENVPFRELPAFLRDGKYVIPSQEEVKHQKEMFTETGLTQSERNLAIDFFTADLELVSEMQKNPILAGSDALDKQLAYFSKKHGEEFRKALAEEFPEAHQYFENRERVRQAEAEAEVEKSQPTIQQELQEAAEALGITPQQLDSMRRGSEVDE